MIIIYDYFNTFEKQNSIKIKQNYVYNNGKKIIKINPSYKNINFSFEALKKNKLYQYKLQINLNSTKNLNYIEKNLIKRLLQRDSKFKPDLNEIKLLKKNFSMYPIQFYNNNWIKFNEEKQINKNTLKIQKIKKTNSLFNFLIVNCSLRTDFSLFSLWDKMSVIAPKRLNTLLLKYFKEDQIFNTHDNVLSENTIFVDYVVKDLKISKSVKNIIVIHSGFFEKENLITYRNMFFPNMGNQNNLDKCVYYIRQKNTKRNKFNYFKFNLYEKNIFSNLSNKRKRLNFKELPDSLYNSFSSKNNNEHCSICLCNISNTAITKCGHVFCKKCIMSSLKYNPKCPLCRTGLTNKDIYIQSKKLELLLKNDNKDSLIIVNTPKTIQYIKSKCKNSVAAPEDYLFNNELNKFKKIFLLENNSYLTDYTLSMTKKTKVYNIINKK